MKLTDTARWNWYEPTVVTCSELFVNIVGPKVFNIARVRLDSLGPGIPPD